MCVCVCVCVCVCGSRPYSEEGVRSMDVCVCVCVCGQLHSPSVAAEQLAGTRCSAGPPPHYWPTAHL